MPRTTIDIDAGVLRELKRRQHRQGTTLGRLVSEILSSALDSPEPAPGPDFVWTARPLGAQIDLEDKEAVRRALADG